LQLAAMVESSADAIIGKTREGVIVSWNASAERIFGYAAAEVLGQPIDRLMPPERRSEMPDILPRIPPGERIHPYETVRVAKDGRRTLGAPPIVPTRNAAGALIGASPTARDITDQKRAEKRLQAQHTTTQILAGAETQAEALPALLEALGVCLEWDRGEFWGA